MSLEFGLVAATFATALMACVDLGRDVATRTALRAAAGEVTRAAMADTTLTGCSTPHTLALSKVTMLEATSLQVCVTRPAVAPGAQATVSITASYSYSFITPLFGSEARTISASVATPI